VATTAAEDSVLLLLERTIDTALGYPHPTYDMKGNVVSEAGVLHHADSVCAPNVPYLCAMPADAQSLPLLQQIVNDCTDALDSGAWNGAAVPSPCAPAAGLTVVPTLPATFAADGGAWWWCDAAICSTAAPITDEFADAGEVFLDANVDAAKTATDAGHVVAVP